MQQNEGKQEHRRSWTRRWYEVVFEAETFAGRLFDEVLLVLIVLSILVVMLESVEGIRLRIGTTLGWMEFTITLLFSLEYLVRIIVSPRPGKYILSFLGLVDLLAILPTYLAFLVPGAQPLIVIRAIRLLRIYRILKLYRYIRAGKMLILALRASFRKILIFMIFILILVIMLGSIMYVVEEGNHGFYNIPLSIYWAVITLTTVGYGDIVPLTSLGRFIATFIMLLGYSIIAIPTGIVSVELSRVDRKSESSQRICKFCNEKNHDPDASFCKTCGARL